MTNITISLLQNIALLITLVMVNERVIRMWKPTSWQYFLLAGFLFGSIGVIGMTNPVRLMPGIIYDGRTIVLSVAGFAAGPIPAMIAALMCGAYRLWIGGAGALVGVSTVIEATLLGIALHYLRKRYAWVTRSSTLLIFGFLVSVGMLFIQMGLPGGASKDILPQIALPVLTIYPLATWLICELFLDQEASRKTQDDLQKSEARYRLVSENSADVIWLYDLKTRRLVYVSPSIRRLLGWSPQDLLEQPLEFSVAEESLDLVTGLLDERLRRFRGGDTSARIKMTEIVHRRKDGSTIPAEVVTTLVTDDLGEPVSIIGVTRDISERKRHEQELAEREERFRRAIIESPFPTVLHVQGGEILNISQSWLEISGYSVEELPDMSAWADLAIEADKTEVLKVIDHTYTIDRRIEEGDFRIKCKDGSYRIWEFHSAPLGRLPDGKPLVISMANDVTERRKVEHEVQRLNEELEQRVQDRTNQLTAINHELEAFAYSVSHDLRAPLRAMEGFSAALIDEYRSLLDDQGRDYLDRIQAAAKKMDDLINGLLNLSRLSRADMIFTTVNISRMAHEIANTLNQQDPGRQIDWRIQEGLSVTGDPQLLQSLLTNLFENAYKFSVMRSPAVIEFCATEKDGERVYCVRDNGAGFDMAYAQKLFSPFHRLHAAHEFPGNGIGLATVQRIIYRHDGRIWAEAQVDRGAAFSFTLNGKKNEFSSQG